MRLSSIYSNRPEIFPRIDFRHTGLNVVFARVYDPANLKKDSHNLGKTLLVRLLDFVLMGGVDKEHPFRVHEDHFGDFVFFGEFLTNTGTCVTLRRPVMGRADIAINRSTQARQDYSQLPVEQWLHHGLSQSRAEELLNEYFDLAAIKPFDYRKGLGYFLRRQNDYDDEFRISRFGRGKDLDWKPFTALLLGFDAILVRTKYDLEIEIARQKSLLKDVRADSGAKNAAYDEIKGLLEAKTVEADRLHEQVMAFDFQEIESSISTHTVVDIESRVAQLNRERYEVEQEIREIGRSLAPSFEFDIASIQKVFEETQLYFPEQLKKDYESLLQLNRDLVSSRKERLVRLRGELERRKVSIESSLNSLNDERQTAMSVLQERRTLEKYRQLNGVLLQEQEDVRRLRTILGSLDKAEAISDNVSLLEKRMLELAEQLRRSAREGNPIYRRVRERFNGLTQEIIGTPAILAVDPNREDNLEFKTKIVQMGSHLQETSLSEGTSYKKLLCVCFDLALLIAYSASEFYRFVYHDGVFEGLDNRKKVSLLNRVRAACDEHELQYVLTVIDADVPRDESDSRVLFSNDEIVRQLDDRGDMGRLFRMAPF